MIYSETKVTTAAHPRLNEACTVTGAPLEIVYKLYYSDRLPKVQENRRLNLIFAHGNGFSKEVWEYMIEQCFDSFGDILGTVASMDLVNHHESYQLNKEELGFVAPWSDGGHDLVKLARELDLKGVNVLVGHSMGAVQSLFASHYDENLFDSIVAMDPVLYSIDAHVPGALENKEVVDALAAHFSKLEKMRDTFKDEQDYQHYMRNRSPYRKFHSKILDRTIEAKRVVESDGQIKLSTPTRQQMINFYGGQYVFAQHENLLKTLDCEILYLYGNVPGFLPPGSHEWVKERLNHAQVAVVDGGTHCVPYEMPDETWSFVKPFLEHRYQRGLERLERIELRKKLTPELKMKWADEGYKQVKKTYPFNKFHSKL